MVGGVVDLLVDVSCIVCVVRFFMIGELVGDVGVVAGFFFVVHVTVLIGWRALVGCGCWYYVYYY